jgi:hypothetical protein
MLMEVQTGPVKTELCVRESERERVCELCVRPGRFAFPPLPRVQPRERNSG